MKRRSTPGAWLLFGFVGHPIVSVVNEILGWLVFSPILRQLKSWPDFGFGGVGGLLMGPPLGILTACIVHLIATHRHKLARVLAVVGGTLGVVAVLKLAPPRPYTYTGDFGFVATPLLWCAALILWGFLARSPQSENRISRD